MLGLSLVLWEVQRQPIVTQSSTEAEYVSACEAVKRLVWINRLVRKIGNDIYITNNQSTIQLVKDPEFHKRTITSTLGTTSSGSSMKKIYFIYSTSKRKNNNICI